MKNKITDLALYNLDKLYSIKGSSSDLNPDEYPDVDGKINININDVVLEYFSIVKREFRNIHLSEIYLLRKKYINLIVIGENIFPSLREQLRNNEIAYLDMAGNFYLKNPSCFVFTDGNKTAVRMHKKSTRIFSKTGLKILFHFLSDEEFLNRPYREIAGLYGIAVGNIHYFLNDLKKQKLVYSIDKHNLKIVNKKILFQKWLEAYESNLKPLIHLGNFRFGNDDDFENWENITFMDNLTFWGGEAAAGIMTSFCKPVNLTIYTSESKNELIDHYHLVPDMNGYIQAYSKFWKLDNQPNHLVPPLLVYADLLLTTDIRCMHSAQVIYNEYLCKSGF